MHNTLACALLLLCSCSPYPMLAERTNPPPIPSAETTAAITVGIVADAQVQTTRVQHQSGNRSVDLDWWVNAAVRPPALEAAAPHMLAWFLSRMRHVDMVLVLGDVLNNGCQDELLGPEGVLNILREFRQATDTPVFMVVGNHDYLANGNLSGTRDRQDSCGEDNTPLTKLALMRHMSAFNRQSAALSETLGYTDSLTEATEAHCKAPPRQHNRPGCFLAAVLTHQSDVQIALLDTSDYADAPIGSSEYPGNRGALSFRDSTTAERPRSQMAWLRDQTAGSESKVGMRILASHYGIKDLEDSFDAADADMESVLSGLVGPEPPGGSFWFSAHAHRPDPRAFEEPFEGLRVELNVGSTTDWNPHATIAALRNGGLLQTTIRAPDTCRGLLDRMAAASTSPQTPYKPVMGQTAGLVLFGLGASYRNYPTPLSDRQSATANLQTFVEHAVRQGLPEGANLDRASARELWTCIGHLSSWFEGDQFD